ncbi:MAG: hypothetical protein OEM41_04960, partial [Ignavibacteria bacterium]|nr:hypothetical protein [Ignavibacteria bacterium]
PFSPVNGPETDGSPAPCDASHNLMDASKFSIPTAIRRNQPPWWANFQLLFVNYGVRDQDRLTVERPANILPVPIILPDYSRQLFTGTS